MYFEVRMQQQETCHDEHSSYSYLGLIGDIIPPPLTPTVYQTAAGHLLVDNL